MDYTIDENGQPIKTERVSPDWLIARLKTVHQNRINRIEERDAYLAEHTTKVTDFDAEIAVYEEEITKLTAVVDVLEAK